MNIKDQLILKRILENKIV